MENQNKNTRPTGIFIEGIVVGSNARLFPPKDGRNASVQVHHELALSPGLAVIEEYFDPTATPAIKTEGGQVTEYPKMEHLSVVKVKATGCRMMGDKPVFKGITRLND